MTKKSRSRPARPPAPVGPPRDRMVIAAAALLAERGVAGTSFSEVIERSGAPRGSIYHHFPDGKDALTGEAIALVGNSVLGILRRREAATPGEVVARFVDAWRATLVRTELKAGCAIAAVVNEPVDHPALRAQADAVFVAWEAELAAALAAAGMASATAGTTATLVIAAVEGALILCRARRELGPLEAVATALAAAVGASA